MKCGVIPLVFLLAAVAAAPSDQPANRVYLILSAAQSQEAHEIRSIVIIELTSELERRGFSVVPEQTWRAGLAREELPASQLLSAGEAAAEPGLPPRRRM